MAVNFAYEVSVVIPVGFFKHAVQSHDMGPMALFLSKGSCAVDFCHHYKSINLIWV
jgi:hypothetical protein